MIETLKTSCSLSGVSSAEDEVRDYILARALPFADSVDSDALGNLFIYKRGDSSPDKQVVLFAHMDEVGLIITSINDEGLFRFGAVGGIDRRVLIGKKVYIGEKRIPGVISLKAIHLTTDEERKKAPKIDELFIDAGFSSKEEAAVSVALGDIAVFDPEILEFGEGYLMAKAIDDRIGCAVLLKLIEEKLPVDTWFVFTVQEEVGCRGAMPAAYRIKPDAALIVEGTTAADLPTVKDDKQICRVGEGVVIPFMDGASIYDKELRRRLENLCDDNRIKRQTKSLITGGTDGSVVQRSTTGVHAVGIAAPVRNIHSPSCVVKLSDAENVLSLARLFLQSFGESAI